MRFTIIIVQNAQLWHAAGVEGRSSVARVRHPPSRMESTHAGGGAQTPLENRMKKIQPGPSITYAPIEAARGFPMDIELAGSRSDEPIRMLHFHNALEIGYCHEGTGTFHVGSKILEYQSGDMTVITDLEVHRCQSARGTVSSWAWFFFQPAMLLEATHAGQYVYTPQAYAGSDFPNVITTEKHPDLVGIVKELIREAGNPADGYESSMRALVVVLLNRMHAAFGHAGRQAVPHHYDTLARISPALDRISQNYHQPLTIPRLAAMCGMSLRNFQVVFSRAMECSPQEYLIRTRVRAAQGLLRGTDMPITEIAFACGFQSLSSFNRAFRNVTQHAPREMR